MHTILILDDDTNTLRAYQRFLEDQYNVFTATETSTALEYIQKYEISVFICDNKLKNESGIEFLTNLNSSYSDMRKVLLSGVLDLDTILTSINYAHVQKVKQKPWQPNEMLEELENLCKEFDRIKANKSILQEYQSIMQESHRLSDDILDVLSNLDENDKLGEFISLVIQALDGIQSFINMNFQTYLYSKDKFSFQHALKYLTDIELIANQYDQKILLIYAMTLRSYFLALIKNQPESELYISGAKEYSKYVNPKYIHSVITQAHEQYKYKQRVIEDQDDMREAHLEIMINNLLQIKINELMVVNEKLFDYIKGNKQIIDYFLVIRNDIPLFNKSAQGKQLEPTLISGFLVALSQFLAETVPGAGDIQNIFHDRGVILIHKYHEFHFIVLSSIDDLWLRVALRDFAQESYEIFSKVPNNHYISNSNSEEIETLLKSYFGNF